MTAVRGVMITSMISITTIVITIVTIISLKLLLFSCVNNPMHFWPRLRRPCLPLHRLPKKCTGTASDGLAMAWGGVSFELQRVHQIQVLPWIVSRFLRIAAVAAIQNHQGLAASGCPPGAARDSAMPEASFGLTPRPSGLRLSVRVSHVLFCTALMRCALFCV